MKQSIHPAAMTNIWGLNKITGQWTLLRESTLESALNWIAVFRSQEADTYFEFVASKNRPRNNGYAKQRSWR